MSLSERSGPAVLGAALLVAAGIGGGFLAAGSRPVAPEDGIARVASGGQLLLAGHTHGDLVLRLRGCQGCLVEFQGGVVGVLRELQRGQATAQVQSGGAK